MSNTQKLATLRPKVAQMAQSLIDQCKTQLGLNLSIVWALRTVAEQNALYAQGRNGNPGKIVTQAKGGFSLHNYGVAFDCVPVDANGNAVWNYDFSKIAKIAQSIGLEWGDRGYPDFDHFEYRAGYSLEDFVSGKIDWSKFELSTNKNTKMEITKETPQVLTIHSVTVEYTKHIDGVEDAGVETATNTTLTQAVVDALKPLITDPEYNVTVVAENLQA